jgi:hypothetical protein
MEFDPSKLQRTIQRRIQFLDTDQYALEREFAAKPFVQGPRVTFQQAVLFLASYFMDGIEHRPVIQCVLECIGARRRTEVCGQFNIDEALLRGGALVLRDANA